MTDRDALLRSILESPHEDAPRLIFADWLEDHGEAARAEFIRVQVELARSKHEPTCRGDIHVSGGLGIRCNCRVSELHRRERELFTHDAIFDWFPMPTDRTGTTCRRKRNEIAFVQFESAGLRDREGRHAPATEQTYHVSRGFVSSIHCSWYDFLRRHESLVWSPKQTMECPECGGSGSRDSGGTNPFGIAVDIACGCDGGRIPRPFTRSVRCRTCQGRGSDRHHGVEVPCGCNACSGRGTVEQPLAETAQPITDVILTTTPVNVRNDNHIWIGVIRFDRVKCETCGGHVIDNYLGRDLRPCPTCNGRNSWTCPAWPGVKFAMSE